jgi:hypothetical protein
MMMDDDARTVSISLEMVINLLLELAPQISIKWEKDGT